jgi:1-acyl-sn-glycerol-3-phosphate acyltransferase
VTFHLKFLEIAFRMTSRYLKNRVVGTENLPPKGEGYIAAANHRSFIDGLILPQVLVTARKEAVHMVSYSEIFKVPVMRVILRWAEGLVLDRSSKTGIARFMRDAKYLLTVKHEAVGLHPEAHMQKPKPALGRGRTGAAQLAIETGCPVVPVGLLGTESVMPLGGYKLDYQRRAVSMIIGRPLRFDAYREAYRNGDAKARKEILEGLTTIIMLEIAKLTGQRYHFGARAVARLEGYRPEAA